MKGKPKLAGKPRDGSRVLTLPNALSAARLLAVPFVLALLAYGSDGLAVILFVAAAVTDYLDGKLARRRGGAASSSLGAILDPLADRLLLSGVAFVLALRGILPVPFVAVLVGRDLLALSGALIVRGRVKVNKVGKAATAVLMASIAAIMYPPGAMVGEVLFYVGLALSLASGGLYVASALGTRGTSGGTAGGNPGGGR